MLQKRKKKTVFYTTKNIVSPNLVFFSKVETNVFYIS